MDPKTQRYEVNDNNLESDAQEFLDSAKLSIKPHNNKLEVFTLP